MTSFINRLNGSKRPSFKCAGVCFFILLSFSSCELQQIEAPGNLVPPTSAEDPNLPQITVNVMGKERSLHLQTFGDPDNQALLILHGGPGADFRFFLPFKTLAEKYFVVMWDSRGAGLSERVTKEELTVESFLEEVHEVQKTFSPGRKVILIGHSFGANVLLRYTALNPELVSQLILIEPGLIKLSDNIHSDGGAVGFIDGQHFFWSNEILSSKDHASADYKGIEVLPRSSRNWTCDGEIIENYPFWRFGSYHYFIVTRNLRKLEKSHNWALGIEDFSGHISIIAGSCGALGADFQRKSALPNLPQADFEVIQGAGHITLFTDYAELTLAAVENQLN